MTYIFERPVASVQVLPPCVPVYTSRHIHLEKGLSVTSIILNAPFGAAELATPIPVIYGATSCLSILSFTTAAHPGPHL